MPHKRAKSSVRQTQRKERGSDLVPSNKHSISDETIPKSAQRVLNALKIREDYRAKKRKLQSTSEPGPGQAKRRKTDSSHMKILPGESIQHFNRRVEDDLRPLVKTAMEAGRASARKTVREELEAKQLAKDKKGKRKATPSESEPQSKAKSKTADTVGEGSSSSLSKTVSGKPTIAASHVDKPKEFLSTSSSAPRRLNDIAMAPPELKILPRGSSIAKLAKGSLASSKSDVVSMAQKVMMEQEREKAIKRYRDLKAARHAESSSK